jgi:arylsulfatase
MRSIKGPRDTHPAPLAQSELDRRNVLLSGGSLLTLAATLTTTAQAQETKPASSASTAGKPNILMIMADDIGWFNVSAYNMGVMGYRTPNIDRIGKEGAIFTDWYGEQSCTADAQLLLPASLRSGPD